MRRAIDTRPRKLKDVLSNDSIRRDFLKGVPKNDAKVVKAFVAANAGNALKTRPKVSYCALSLLFLRVHQQLYVCGHLLHAWCSASLRRVRSGSSVGHWGCAITIGGSVQNVRNSHRLVCESDVGIGRR